MKIYLLYGIGGVKAYSSRNQAVKNAALYISKQKNFDIKGLGEAFQREDYEKCVELWNNFVTLYCLSSLYVFRISEEDIDSKFI